MKKSVLLLCLIPALANADFDHLINVSAGYEDNLPRGLDDFHRRSSNFLNLDYSFGRSYLPGLNDIISVSAGLNAARYIDYSGLDNVGFSASVLWQHKFGFGPYVPRLNFTLDFNYAEFNKEARDNGLLTSGIFFSKRLNDTWRFQVGFEYQESYAKNLRDDPLVTSLGYSADIRLPYELFDFNASSLFAGLDYFFPSKLLISLGYTRTDGATVSSTTKPSLAAYKKADAFYSDPGLPEGYFAYQFATINDEWSISASYPIAEDSSLDLSWATQDIKATGDRDYDNERFVLSFVQRF